MMEGSLSSQHSTVTSNCGSDNQQDICRICRSEGGPDSPLISPCYCSGSMRYVHQSCLQKSIQSLNSQHCELCKFHFIIHTKVKPFREWKTLDTCPGKVLGVLCCISIFVFFIFFFVAFIITVVGFLCFLIQGFAEDKWRVDLFLFAIGLPSNLFYVFLISIACVSIFYKWRNLNTIIYVEDAPEKGSMAQQQQAGINSATSQFAASELTSEESKRLLLKENEFKCCEGNSKSTSTSHNYNSNNAEFNGADNIFGKIPNEETCSTDSMLTSVRDNGQLPEDDHNHPLIEIVTISTATDFVPGTEEQNPFLFKQNSQLETTHKSMTRFSG